MSFLDDIKQNLREWAVDVDSEKTYVCPCYLEVIESSDPDSQMNHPNYVNTRQHFWLFFHLEVSNGSFLYSIVWEWYPIRFQKFLDLVRIVYYFGDIYVWNENVYYPNFQFPFLVLWDKEKTDFFSNQHWKELEE